MKQCIPSLLALLAPLAPAFREEVFDTFCVMTGAWILCLGRRTISRVWETTGEAQKRNHASAFRLFSEAACVLPQSNLEKRFVRVSITCTEVSHEQAASFLSRSRKSRHHQTAPHRQGPRFR